MNSRAGLNSPSQPLLFFFLFLHLLHLLLFLLLLPLLLLLLVFLRCGWLWFPVLYVGGKNGK